MEPSEDIKIILDTEDFSIIKPLTLQSLCSFDKEHYLCQGYHRAAQNFNKEETSTYTFINKQNNRVETYRRLADNTIIDSNENEVSLSDVQKYLKDYFGVSTKTTKKLLGSNFFNQLRKYLRGQISSSTLENADPMIDYVRGEGENTKIELKFSDFDDFLSKIGLNDDDISFYNWVKSGKWEFRTYDSDYEDMKEGYGPFHYFNDENLKKLEYIKSFLMPKVPFEKNEGFFSKLFKILYEEFPRYMDDILYRWTDALNEQMNESAWQDVSESLKKYFEDKSIDVNLRNETVKFSPIDILNYYSVVGDTKLTLSELFREHFEDKKYSSIGGWYDDQFNYENVSQLDMDNLNTKWGEELDEIIDKIEEDKGEYQKIYNLYWKLHDKYGFRKIQRTPKNPNLWFQIIGVDQSTGKINVQIIKTKEVDEKKTTSIPRDFRIPEFSNKDVIDHKMHSFSEENFNLFLNHPELFDIFSS